LTFGSLCCFTLCLLLVCFCAFRAVSNYSGCYLVLCFCRVSAHFFLVRFCTTFYSNLLLTSSLLVMRSYRKSCIQFQAVHW
jgi:hypothetical protein